MVPGAGEIADAINGGLYTLEGKGFEAGLIFAAMLPLGGQLATAGKWASNALKFSDNAFHSASGLVFKLGSKEGNSLSHVLSYTVDNVKKADHGIFSVGDDLISLDNARDVAKQGGDNVIRTVQENGNISYVVDMGRQVGTAGGKNGSGEALNRIQFIIKKVI